MKDAKKCNTLFLDHNLNASIVLPVQIHCTCSLHTSHYDYTVLYKFGLRKKDLLVNNIFVAILLLFISY